MTITVSIEITDPENQAALAELVSDLGVASGNVWGEQVLTSLIEEKRVLRLRRRVAELGAMIESAPYEARMSLDAAVVKAVGE